ncbi:FMN-dependent NADH-azoreductase [Ferrimonas marina]|uniref:FMN dependent NADH:quinone oxidoreductase n=1 Tax=Ferrimonas marina TaxID=299255 RepID=A0A1M5MZV6_9GAMM|nr:NAD(P)H-dependent oxidoreductase [Ferrimonas marina]SHG82735.1 FMN-dependent NADH-azoreductase [Ferrimonas marina]
MTSLLIINASPNPTDSASRQLAQHFEQQWRDRHPGGKVVHRDLANTPLPHLDQATIAAFYTPAEARSEQQQQQLALSDQLVAELRQADQVVIAAPMHNFSIPSSLKAWIDQICRVGETFQYGANGPEGLLSGRQATLLLTRGGDYSNPAMAALNHQDSVLATAMGFVGIEVVASIAAEGTAKGPEGMALAKQQISALFPQAEPALA